MKKLKKSQLGHWCSYCEPKTTRAIYVQSGWHGMFACEKHKDKLMADEKKEEKFTEADRQSWMRIAH